MLSKNDILEINDTRIEKVYVPEWGAEIYVRSITAKQQDEWAATSTKNKESGNTNFQASFLVLSICDEQGKVLFDKKDADLLCNKSASALNRLFAVASELNGMSIKEQEKNSETTQGDDFITV